MKFTKQTSTSKEKPKEVAVAQNSKLQKNETSTIKKVENLLEYEL